MPGWKPSLGVLGPVHAHTLDLQSRLAAVYRDLCVPAEAERIFSAMLEAQRRVLGPEDSRTLETQHHLALLEYKRGRLADAERLYRGTWEARACGFRPANQYTLLAQNNLAAVYLARVSSRRPNPSSAARWRPPNGGTARITPTPWSVGTTWRCSTRPGAGQRRAKCLPRHAGGRTGGLRFGQDADPMATWRGGTGRWATPR